MSFDITKMQSVLEQGLINDRVVTVDGESLSLFRALGMEALSLSDESLLSRLSPEGIVFKNVLFLTKHSAPSGIDKHMMMSFANEVAGCYPGVVTPEAILKTKLAICFAFEQAFPAPSGAFRQEGIQQSHPSPTPTPGS
jgi:hypothetical protein